LTPAKDSLHVFGGWYRIPKVLAGGGKKSEVKGNGGQMKYRSHGKKLNCKKLKTVNRQFRAVQVTQVLKKGGGKRGAAQLFINTPVVMPRSALRLTEIKGAREIKRTGKELALRRF